MKRNKIKAAVLCLIMLFSVVLSACGGGGDGGPSAFAILTDRNPTAYLGADPIEVRCEFPKGYTITATLTDNTKHIANVRMLDTTRTRFSVTPLMAGNAVLEFKNSGTLVDAITIACRLPIVEEFVYSGQDYYSIPMGADAAFSINYPQSYNISVALTDETKHMATVSLVDAFNRQYRVTPIIPGAVTVEIKNGNTLLKSVIVSTQPTEFVLISQKNPIIALDETYTLVVDYPEMYEGEIFVFDEPEATVDTASNAQMRTVPGSNNKRFEIVPMHEGNYVVELKSNGELIETVTVTIQAIVYEQVAEFVLYSENPAVVSFEDGYLLRMNYTDGVEPYFDPAAVNFNKYASQILDKEGQPMKSVRIMPMDAISLELDVKVIVRDANDNALLADIDVKFKRTIDAQGRDITKYETPEEGFTIDGLIDASEQALYTVLPQRFGVEGQLIFGYYFGEKGLYFHFDVNDPLCYTGSSNYYGRYTESFIRDCDRVEIFLDTLVDKAVTPQADDLTIRITLTGEYLVYFGNGTSFDTPTWSQGVDAIKTTIKEGTYTTARDPMYNSDTIPATDVAPDPGYTVELFMSYSNFGFEKRDIYGATLATADMWDPVEAQRFISTGSISSPQEFLSLSQYGFGTSVDIDRGIEVNGEKPDYFVAENVYDETENPTGDRNLRYFEVNRDWGQDPKYKMTTQTYVYTGQNGLHIYMFAKSDYLRYYYSEGFSYQSDHVEMRVDTDNSESHSTVDRFFFADIMGTNATALGINNEGRVAAAYDMVFVTKYTGKIMNSVGGIYIDTGAAENTFTFHAFFPWYSLGIAPGATFGMFLCCGNPDEGKVGVGNVFYEATHYGEYNMWHAFEYYQNYTKFQRPAVA